MNSILTNHFLQMALFNLFGRARTPLKSKFYSLRLSRRQSYSFDDNSHTTTGAESRKIDGKLIRQLAGVKTALDRLTNVLTDQFH